jgi:peptide-methionine (S)-S-oxide reductase
MNERTTVTATATCVGITAAPGRHGSLASAGLAVLLLLGAATLATPFAARAQAGGSPAAAATPAAQQTARATFAGGCFWCTEADFDKVPGVVSTTSGYIGGQVAHPTYEQVSGNTTGHAEAVQIVYDPARVTYQQLLNVYWRSIDPTTRDRQFCDVGSPYRTAVFTHGPEQLQAAKQSLAELEKTKPFRDPIVTQIQPAATFYPAEAYHQDYHTKNPVRYRYYRATCGRDSRLQELWGKTG